MNRKVIYALSGIFLLTFGLLTQAQSQPNAYENTTYSYNTIFPGGIISLQGIFVVVIFALFLFFLFAFFMALYRFMKENAHL